jgi:hypothetical protein
MTGATSPYWTPAECATYWRRPSGAAFILFAKRHNIPRIECGRVVLYDRDVVMAHFKHSTTGQSARMPKSSMTTRYAAAAAGATQTTSAERTS